MHPGKGCAFASVPHKIDYYDSGPFSYRCPHCNALLLKSEVPKTGQKYTHCCKGGKVELGEQFDLLQDMPFPLNLYAADPCSVEAKHFIKTSRFYNGHLAFGVVRKEHDPKPIGPGYPVVRVNGMFTYELPDIHPLPEGTANLAFAQHFVIDPEEAVHAKIVKYGNKIRPAVFEKLLQMVRDNHVLAQAFIDGHELLKRMQEKSGGDVSADTARAAL